MPILRNLFGRQEQRGRKPLPLLTGRHTSADVDVTPERALQIAAVYSCVRLLSETASSLPVGLYRRTSTGRQRADNHPAARLLSESPNPDMDSGEFWRQVVAWMGIRGNAFVYIERDQAGRPRGLWPVSPNCVDVRRGTDGRLVYQVRPDQLIDYAPITERGGLVRSENMLHYRTMGTGPEGLSPVGMARQQVGISFASLSYIGGFFARDASPGGTVSVDGSLTEGQYERLTQQWKSLHEGFDKAHKLAVLEGGAKWEKTTLSPADAAFLDVYKLTRSDIAGIYGVPPHMIGDVDSSTSWGSGIEQQSLGYVIYSLTPYLTRLERATRAKLFTNSAHYLRFNVDGLVRGDIATRYSAYAQGRQWGWLSTNDIRRLEDDDPIGAQGDVYLQPLNMVEAGQPPARGSAGGGDPRSVRQAPPREERVRPAVEQYPSWVDRHQQRLSAVLEDQAEEVAAILQAQGRSLRQVSADAISQALTSRGYNDRMATQLARLAQDFTSEVGATTASELGGYYDAERTQAYLQANAEYSAQNINLGTAGLILELIRSLLDGGPAAEEAEEPVPVGEVAAAVTTGFVAERAATLATERVAWGVNFAINEAGSQTGARSKTWVATGGNHRESHAAADGQTVAIDEEFTVGGARGRWPRDYRLGVDEVAGCDCVLQINM